MHRPIRAARRPDGAFQVDGTPTDCVLLALGGLLPERPSFVFSGVNHGPNMGEDVLYSGTVAAAMEGVTLGVPGVAISFTGQSPETLSTYKDILISLVKRITKAREFPADTILNINLPDRPASEVRGLKITRLGSRRITSYNVCYTKLLRSFNHPGSRDQSRRCTS